MSLRINSNVAAVNAHRNLVKNDARLGKNLEHLSSGLKINRASDGPASLVISEQMRAQVSGLKQAIMNSQTAVSMVQTTEAALNEVNSILISMRQLSIHAANEGANDEVMLSADQAEFENALSTLSRIAETTQFGTKKILDGTYGINGATSGANLEFLSATTKTVPSPQSGYGVDITQEATQTQVTGRIGLTQDMIDSGETLTVIEDGKTIELSTQVGQSLKDVENSLKAEMDKKGMDLDIYFDQLGRLTVTHRDYGSEPNFTVISSSDGVLSERASVPTVIQNGLDVRGTIGGEQAVGTGQVLAGAEGTNIEGLKIRFTGNAAEFDASKSRVTVQPNALNFQVGGNHNQIVKIILPNMKAETLGGGVDNDSNYKSLEDIDLKDSQGAQDAMLLIDEAINKVSSTRAELGAVQKNTLESNINSLSVARESLISSESVIRDTDMAAEMSDFTKNQILSQAATAMLAQANQTPNNILTLLK